MLNGGACAGGKPTGGRLEAQPDMDVRLSRPRSKYRSEGTPAKPGHEYGVPFLLVRFLWASKENEQPFDMAFTKKRSKPLTKQLQQQGKTQHRQNHHP